MNPLSRALLAFASMIGFYGCDADQLAQLKPGISAAQEVRERLGPPGTEWPNGDGSVTWEYPRGPEGTRCWMLTLNAGGVLQKIEQALTEENFARIENGVSVEANVGFIDVKRSGRNQKGWRGEQVRRLLGKPAGEVKFPLKPEVVWEWRIDPATPGNSAWFHVHFSPEGFVTRTSRREEPPVG